MDATLPKGRGYLMAALLAQFSVVSLWQLLPEPSQRWWVKSCLKWCPRWCLRWCAKCARNIKASGRLPDTWI